MAQIETWLNQEMTQAVKVRYLDGNLFSMDNAGNLIGVILTKNGVDYDGGGTVSANVIRSDGGTVAVSGTLAGNVATIVLPQAAYAVPGIVSIVIKLYAEDVITTIAAVVANVYQSSTDTAIDPGTIIPSIQTLIAQINAAVATIPLDYSALNKVLSWYTTSYNVFSGVGEITGKYIKTRTVGSAIEYAGSSSRNVYDRTIKVEAGVPYSLYSTSESTATYYIVIVDENNIVLEKSSYTGNTSRVDFTPSYSGWLCFDIHKDAINIMIQEGVGRSSEYSVKNGNTYGITTNKAVTRVPTYEEYESVVAYEKELYGRTNDIEFLSGKLLTNGETNLLSTYVSRGGINSGVIDLSWDYRAFTVPILIFAYDVVVSCTSDYRMRIALYEDGVYQSRIDWTTSYTVSAGTEFRITIRSYPEDEAVQMNVVNAASAVTLTYTGFAKGKGSSLYYGNPVRLVPDYTQKNRCDIQLWKDFTNTDDSWKAYDSQSLAIHGDYVFILNSDGAGFVLNKSTKEVISTITMPSISNNHQNSAQFGNVYYDASDNFPLLYVSHKDATTEYMECLIYRILLSDSTFTVTLVNKITWEHVAYGGSVIVDNSAKTLNIVSYFNGGYNVTENNPTIVATFKLPSTANILSGNAITLSDADIVSIFEFNHVTLQDGCACNGFIFVGVTDEEETSPKQFVYAIDVNKGNVVSKIRMLNNLEIEGVDVDQNIMYITQRRGANSGNDNPLKSYTVEFA